MKWQKIFLIFLYGFICQQQRSSISATTTMGFQAMKVIGFFSICGENDPGRRTEFNTEALFYSEMIKDRFSKPCVIENQCSKRMIDYRYYDVCSDGMKLGHLVMLSLIHISEPTRPRLISYAVFCLKKKKY